MFTGKMPHYNVYETRDGKFISIGSLEPAFFHNLCRAIGREDLIPLEWRIDKWDELTAGFEETFLTRTRDEWFAILKEIDTCVAPVYDVDEIFDDPPRAGSTGSPLAPRGPECGARAAPTRRADTSKDLGRRDGGRSAPRSR